MDRQRGARGCVARCVDPIDPRRARSYRKGVERMMGHRAVLLLLAVISLPLCGFQVVDGKGKVPPSGQALGERAAQDGLPQAKDQLWTALRKCPVKLDEKTQLYGIGVTPEVGALNGKTVRLSGFVLPMDGLDKTKYFLLSKRTPVCLYCPPGEPNEVVAVRSKHAVDWKDDMITVSGLFALVNDGEKGIFFEMRDADTVK